jgi:hypothetical protein
VTVRLGEDTFISVSDEEQGFEAAVIDEGTPACVNIAELDLDEAAVTGPMFCEFAIPSATVELELDE